MQRRLEVLMVAGEYSRLTITPERITVKIAAAHTSYAEAWTEAAKVIAARIDFGRSLRGKFDPEMPAIWLSTGGSRHTAGYVGFFYDFNGELLRRTDAEGK